MSEEAPRNGRTGLRLIGVGAVLGIVLAAGAGFGMKVTDRRPFCASCHIMQEAALTHKASAHANLACNECHAPQNLAAKLSFKAAAGTKDVYMNTLGRPGDVIPASQSTKDVVNANCKACHTMTNMQVASMDSKPYCVDCHRNVQHMRMMPISTRKVADG